VTTEAQRTSLPRPLLLIGTPAAGLFLVLLFIYLGFPYAKLGDRIAAEMQRAQGVRVDFQSAGPSLHLAGPGIEVTGLRATLSDGKTLRFERAMLRPAWSAAWFRGAPALYAEIESELGGAEGTLILGAAGGWSGDLAQVALGKLPLAGLASMGRLEGLLDASIDILLGEEGPEGYMSFEVRDGSVDFPNFPVSVPFETLSGELQFGDEAYLAVKRLDLAGPMLDAGLTGNVLRAASFDQAPLRLEAQFEADPSLRSAMKNAGLRVDRNGKAKLRITGTVARPNVR
jgi:type II secretion system protein N